MVNNMHLEYEFIEGYHIFTSNDFPGLYVAHKDLYTAVKGVEPSVKTFENFYAKKSCVPVESVDSE